MARERKRSSFLARDPDYAAKLEMSPPPSAPIVSPMKHEGESSQERSAQPEAVNNPVKPEHSSPTSLDAPRVTPTPAQRKTAQSPSGAHVRISFAWSQELVDRAAAMANAMRCPVRTVFLRAWSEGKEQLVSELEAGIRFSDIPVGRVQKRGERFDSRLTLSETAYAALKAEIDPGDLAGLSSPLSRWAREKMHIHAHAFLSRAGY